MSTQQVAELRIKNVEIEEFINLRSDKIKKLEKSIHETFRGKSVNPYIFNIFPEIPYSNNLKKIPHNYKIAYV